ncbi:MAG: grasp-with-spasm system ATP-grasp peptide maturase [Crocinitomix sp.]|nr:grasp-with-spasm system ATP-grasp peptide maturase [Crocinitomix sp.]
MILILSRKEAESTTDNVIDWLRHKNEKYYRLNGNDLFNGDVEIQFKFDNGKWEFEIVEGEINIKSSEISAVWFRRAFDSYKIVDVETKDVEEFILVNKLNKYLRSEAWATYGLIEKSLRDVYWINRPSDSTNKFNNLQIAEEVGIKTPPSIVVNNKKHLKQFLEKHPKAITKACREAESFKIGKEFISGLTERVNATSLDKLPNELFFPSFFQGEISKAYEVRVFYLDGVIYPTAIFSQINKETEIDYRNYNTENPNRMEIIDLPNEIKEKLHLFMARMNMVCGSIDLIKSLEDDDYYFLEINPVGQFMGISDMGNLKLDKIVAETLIKYSRV